jgi:hypothetical protein
MADNGNGNRMLSDRYVGPGRSRVTFSPNNLQPEERRDPDLPRRMQEASREATRMNRLLIRGERNKRQSDRRRAYRE